MKTATVSGLFLVAALYDGLLGLAFLVAAGWIFQSAQVTPPNHLGYVHFPGALLMIFGIMFAAIARRPRENRGLIPYGILLKLAYCGVAGYHWLAGGIPALWKPFVLIDLVFLALFILAYRSLEKMGSSGFRCERGKTAAGVPPLGGISGSIPPKGGTPARSPVQFAPKTGRARKCKIRWCGGRITNCQNSSTGSSRGLGPWC